MTPLDDILSDLEQAHGDAQAEKLWATADTIAQAAGTIRALRELLRPLADGVLPCEGTIKGWRIGRYIESAAMKRAHEYLYGPNLIASAIEAATAGETTKIGSTEGESAVAKPDARKAAQKEGE